MRTRVGYTGGTTANPTYYNLGDHTETVEIDFDPTVISYEELLELFWSNHDATSPPWSPQYMSALWFHSEEQRRLAEGVKERLEARTGQRLYTLIAPATTFYLAEDYHQKYYLRRNADLLAAYTAIYPTTAKLIGSTAVARVNGYLGGNGSASALAGEMEQLGLSPAAQERLRQSLPRWMR